MNNIAFSRKITKVALYGLGVCATPILVVGVASIAAVVFMLDKVQGGPEVAEHDALSAGPGLN